MANRIKYIHNLEETNNSLNWSIGYPLAVDGINVDLFNTLNLEEELKIGGGDHSVDISDISNNENNPNTFPYNFDIEGSEIEDFLAEITLNNKVSSTKIEESYNYTDAEKEFASCVIIDEYSALKENSENSEEYTVTIIKIQLIEYRLNPQAQNEAERKIEEKTREKVIAILENETTTNIKEVLIS